MKYGDYQRNGRHIRYGEWMDIFPAIEVLDKGAEGTFVYDKGHAAAAEADLERYLETGKAPTPSETSNRMFGGDFCDIKVTVTVRED